MDPGVRSRVTEFLWSHINYLTVILRDPGSRFLPFVHLGRTQTKTTLRLPQKHKIPSSWDFVSFVDPRVRSRVTNSLRSKVLATPPHLSQATSLRLSNLPAGKAVCLLYGSTQEKRPTQKVGSFFNAWTLGDSNS